MAERVVIAEIALDDTQIAGATQRVRSSIGGIDQGVAALTHRMFNLRAAVRALLGGFTLAGIILKLGELSKALITNTGTWKAWSEAASDAFSRVAQGATSLNRLAKQIKEAGPGGIESLVLLTERIPDLIKQREKLAEAMASPTGVPATLADLFLGPGGESESRIAAMKSIIQRDMGAISIEFEKLRVQLGLTAEQWNVLFPAAALPGGATVTAPGGGGITAGIEDHAEAIGQLTHGYFVWHGAAKSLMEDFDTWAEGPLEEMTVGQTELVSVLDLAIERTELWQSALATGFSLIGSAVAESGLTGRRALGLLLQQMSQMSFAFAAMHTAAALGATTFLGMAITGGTTAQHAAAAAKWGAVGLGTAILAGQLGGHGGGGRSGFGGETAAPAGGGTTQNIQVFFEGNVGSPEFFRRAVIDIQKTLRDGVGGGSI